MALGAGGIQIGTPSPQPTNTRLPWKATPKRFPALPRSLCPPARRRSRARRLAPRRRRRRPRASPRCPAFPCSPRVSSRASFLPISQRSMPAEAQRPPLGEGVGSDSKTSRSYTEEPLHLVPGARPSAEPQDHIAPLIPRNRCISSLVRGPAQNRRTTSRLLYRGTAASRPWCEAQRRAAGPHRASYTEEPLHLVPGARPSAELQDHMIALRFMRQRAHRLCHERALVCIAPLGILTLRHVH